MDAHSMVLSDREPKFDNCLRIPDSVRAETFAGARRALTTDSQKPGSPTIGKPKSISALNVPLRAPFAVEHSKNASNGNETLRLLGT
ncbi:MAG: hypothetical protein H0W33_02645 [Gammaproteobacteria bacterium]|nr:hypothetical protein [Gammaproteobacteria bacterium]